MNNWTAALASLAHLLLHQQLAMAALMPCDPLSKLRAQAVLPGYREHVALAPCEAHAHQASAQFKPACRPCEWCQDGELCRRPSATGCWRSTPSPSTRPGARRRAPPGGTSSTTKVGSAACLGHLAPARAPLHPTLGNLLQLPALAGTERSHRNRHGQTSLCAALQVHKATRKCLALSGVRQAVLCRAGHVNQGRGGGVLHRHQAPPQGVCLAG